MKNNLFKRLLVFLTVLSTGFAYSQTVSGKISDSSGPLPGASVLVKGTTNGTTSDASGAYKINAGSNAVLVFSYIGLKSQEVAVSGKSVVNVVMKDDQQELKEVVVIGYGSVKKKDATGAVDQLNSKSFDNVSATSPGDILKGKVSGVQVTSSSGEPGAATSIRIRGNTSIRSGNGPLIVVDGVPLDGGVSAGGDNLLGDSTARNPLNFINQNDIESMSILKDASSTAIYGSRGANGVVVITTKKSKSKEPQLTYTSSVQFSKRAGSFNVLSADRFLALGGINKGSKSYNWEDAILQNGLAINNDVSFSKSTDNSNTRISFGASNNTGIVKNTGLDKYTASVTNSNDFFNGALKIEERISYAGLKDQTTLITTNSGYIGNVIGAALYWNPTLPIYNANGSYYSFGNNGPQGANDDDYLNPVQLLNSYDDRTNTSKILANINATVKINKHLKYTLLFGVENSNSTRSSQLLPSIHIKDVAQATQGGEKKYGAAGIQDQNRFNKTIEHTLNYNNDFGSNFNLNVLAGYSYYDYTGNGHTIRAKGFNPDQVNLIDNIEGGFRNEYRPDSYKYRSEIQSVYTRLDATLFNKLLLTGTLRRDGSTKPGINNTYQTFPSAGIGYKVISNKDGLVNDFKIRGSYGITGNQDFAINSALGRSSYALDGALVLDSNKNEDLKWETTTQYGVGADFTLFKNKLTGSVDYYMKDTKDLIFPVPAASTQPGPPSPRYKNLPGNLINKGFEVNANVKVIEKENFTWDVSANASFLQNKMTNFAGFLGTGALNGQGLSNAYAQVITNDTPLYSYFIYEWKGYDSTGASIYADAAGNNTDLGLAAKKVLDKQPLPKMTLGFSTNVTYKGFDASTSFYGAFGHYIYNNTSNAYFFKGAFGPRNVTEDVATSNQAAGDPNSPSTKYLEKGDFLRMGNLTLGYTFKGNALERMKIKSARFYVNGSNLLLFTDYTGFDPEVDVDKQLNGVPSAGMDYLAYPKAKSLGFGVNVTF
jgi:TonB-dependent starch-binding outer membrane protein SusC